MMIRKNKSQFALEFVMLIALMFLIFLGFFAILSSRILEAKEEENRQIAQNLANLVFDEIKLAGSAADGYSRTFNIPAKVKGGSYTISIIDNRELIVNYLENEHVVFLPENVQGDVNAGTNKIEKINGIVILQSIAQCGDGVDNDGDGAIDLTDLGCDDASDNDETNCGDNVCEGFESCSSCMQDCGECPSLNILIMKDVLENALAFRTNGDVVLKGTLTENSDPIQTSDDEFIFKDGISVNVALVNLITGNMIIKGSLNENQPTLTPSPTSDDFVVKDSNGNVVSYIDESGNFYLKGTLTENGNP